MRRRLTMLLVALVVLSAPVDALADAATATPTGPTVTQPVDGPGGSAALFDRVVLTQHREAGGYWLWEPADPHADAPGGPLPLVLFFHGFMGTEPSAYQAWLEHIVGRGAIVIDPVLVGIEPGVDRTQGVVTIKAALAELAKAAHAFKPDLTRVAAFGHSGGAAAAANYAALAPALGMPVPGALLIASPGCDQAACIGDYRPILASTLIVLTNDADDEFAAAGTLEQDKIIWAELAGIPADHKTFITLRSDDHGTPPLLADHGQSLAPEGGADALDWYGTWRLLDALMGCAFAQRDCQYVFGDDPDVRYMGTWSDGTPVTPAEVIADPGPPATPTATG